MGQHSTVVQSCNAVLLCAALQGLQANWVLHTPAGRSRDGTDSKLSVG